VERYHCCAIAVVSEPPGAGVAQMMMALTAQPSAIPQPEPQQQCERLRAHHKCPNPNLTNACCRIVSCKRTVLIK